MENEYVMGCPECSMAKGMNSPLSENDEHLQCASDPHHRFRRDESGFLKSV
jgi:hypothetical protein